MERGSLRRGLVGIVLASLILASCGQGTTVTPAPGAKPPSAATPRKGGELRLAFPTTDAGDVRTLDPSIDGATFANTITTAVYETLVYQDPDTNEIVPGLAESWEVSNEGKTYTFKLKKQAKFHDGNPVNAEAVKFTFDRAVDPKYRPGNAFPSNLMVAYDRSEIIDDYTIKVHLKVPQANFLQSALGRSYIGIVSPKAVEKAGGVPAFGKNPIGGGSGPFKFKEWIAGERIVIERNDEWTWGPKFLRPGPVLIDRVVFRFIPEAATRGAALESGEVNAIDGVPEADQARLAADPKYQIIEVRKNGRPAKLDLNMIFGPTKELEVRRAIALALNRDAINKTVYFGVHVPTQYILEEKMFAIDKTAKLPDFNQAEAKRVLDAAGWAMEASGVRSKNGQKLEMNAVTYSDAPVLEAVQAQLAAVGIKINVQRMPRAAYTDRTRTGAGVELWGIGFSLAQGWTNEDPHIMFTNFHGKNIAPGGTGNDSYYNNAEVNKWLEEGYSTLDLKKRQELYSKVQHQVVKDVVDIPLYSMYRNMAALKGVHGLRSDARGTYRYLTDVWLEEGVK